MLKRKLGWIIYDNPSEIQRSTVSPWFLADLHLFFVFFWWCCSTSLSLLSFFDEISSLQRKSRIALDPTSHTRPPSAQTGSLWEKIWMCACGTRFCFYLSITCHTRHSRDNTCNMRTKTGFFLWWKLATQNVFQCAISLKRCQIKFPL